MASVPMYARGIGERHGNNMNSRNHSRVRRASMMIAVLSMAGRRICLRSRPRRTEGPPLGGAPVAARHAASGPWATSDSHACPCSGEPSNTAGEQGDGDEQRRRRRRRVDCMSPSEDPPAPPKFPLPRETLVMTNEPPRQILRFEGLLQLPIGSRINLDNVPGHPQVPLDRKRFPSGRADAIVVGLGCGAPSPRVAVWCCSSSSPIGATKVRGCFSRGGVSSSHLCTDHRPRR